jgi:hypothetical protein
MLHNILWSGLLGCAFYHMDYEHLTAMLFTLQGLCFAVYLCLLQVNA